MTEIGYCSSCVQESCPTPSIRGKEGVNCSHWTDGDPLPLVNEHDECEKCGAIMTIDDGFPLRCKVCKHNTEEGV